MTILERLRKAMGLGGIAEMEDEQDYDGVNAAVWDDEIAETTVSDIREAMKDLGFKEPIVLRSVSWD